MKIVEIYLKISRLKLIFKKVYKKLLWAKDFKAIFFESRLCLLSDNIKIEIFQELVNIYMR